MAIQRPFCAFFDPLECFAAWFEAWPGDGHSLAPSVSHFLSTRSPFLVPFLTGFFRVQQKVGTLILTSLLEDLV